MTRIPGVALTVLTLAVAGCSSMQVYGPSAADPNQTGQLEGIPFYSRVPVATQETKLQRTELLVRIEALEIGAADTALQTTTFPPSGTLVLNPANRADVDAAIATLDPKTHACVYAETLKSVGAVMKQLAALPVKPVKDEVVSNTWSVAMVLSPRPYFINTRQPLIGTASSTYKLNADGTLGEATAAVTDDTAKTLLSLLPITAKISKNWGLAGGGASDAAKAPTGIKSLATVTMACKLNVTVAERITLSTLRRALAVETPAAINAALASQPLAPLTLDDARLGANRVQLVSVEVSSGDDKAAPEKPSYKFSGSVTPPKPADGK
jgi:hypothetical protein